MWLSADVGFQALSLTTLHNELIEEGRDAGGSGLAVGGGLGARLLYFTLGARFRYADLSSFSIWSILGEAALRVPLGKLEPYGLLGVGYVAVGDLYGIGSVGGVALRFGGGTDYYLSDSFSVGAQISSDLNILAGLLGTATGLGGTGLIDLGLHF